MRGRRHTRRQGSDQWTSRRTRGFTLVEILVVVVIIGIVSVGAVLSLSVLGSDRELNAEGERLVALFDYAAEQASLQTRELGLYCLSGGYRFLVYDALRNQWKPLEDDDALRPRQLPRGLQLQLNVDGQDVTLKDQLPPQPPSQTPPQTQPQTRSLDSAPFSSSPNPTTTASTTTASLAADPRARLQPQIMIFSNGDLSLFRVRFTRDGSQRVVQVSSDAQGHITLSEPQANTGTASP